MPAFLVRVIDTHEAVGLFVADEIEELAFVIDEITDARDCEFLEIDGAGGIMWRDGAEKLPIVHPTEWIDEERSEVVVVGKSFLSESWFAALTDKDAVFTRVIPEHDIPANDW